MNKKGLYAVLMASLLPLVCYFIVRHYSDQALSMPRHYIPDSVGAKQENGKMVSDTQWHKLPNITLRNQLGDTVRLSDFDEKIIIADFFFTNCPTICPALTTNMRTLVSSITNSQRVGDKTNHHIHFLSFSVDPERDSVPLLKKWADRFQINPEQWDLLTGDKKSIYDFALNDLKLALVDGKGVDTSFIHTDHFVLIDGKRNIRGYYHGLDSADFAKISRDAILLTLEKDRSKKSSFPVKTLVTAFLITAAAVGLFMILFKSKTMFATPWKKNDKKANALILSFSIIVFIVVAALGKIQLQVNPTFNVHIFALINAVINTAVALLLITALIAIKNKKVQLHKRLMLLAMLLSVLFLISYICHHLLTGDTKFGGSGIAKTLYYIILLTHIPLAGIILPFILYTAYRALTAQYPRHKKLAKITWPLWFYVAVSGVAVYIMISPYY